MEVKKKVDKHWTENYREGKMRQARMSKREEKVN